MKPEDVAAPFAEWRRAPAGCVAAGVGAGPADSHFGGVPLLPVGEGWPVCPGCGRPMQLFVQLDLGALPEGAPVAGRREGVLQLFHCASSDWTDRICEAESETFEPFRPGRWRARAGGEGGAAAGGGAGGV